MKVVFGCTLALVLAVVAAFPQKEGGAYTNEAIRQAQNTFLIPKDAEIQKVSSSFSYLQYIYEFIGLIA